MYPRVWRSSINGSYYKQRNPREFEAQVIIPTDIADIEAVTILDEVLGRARPAYRLRPICRPIRMDSLTARIDVATALTGQEKVPPLVEAGISSESYSAVDFDLWKNVVHIVVIDEVAVYSRALTPKEIYGLATYEPLSGAVRASPGNIVMVYLASVSENLVYKLITARLIDRVTGGEPDEPFVELACEDLGEIAHERIFTKEYTSATQISSIVDDIVDESLPELYLGKDPTNRAIINKFSNEGAWNLLEKLADAATFSTGEKGANFYVDPGGALRFIKYGKFSCGHVISDGSDGNTPNILDIEVKESIKGNPRLANDVRVVVFEAEYMPPDEDSWTESAESWSSPDPTDATYPQSDAGDKKAGTASIHYNTTNPGSQYRIR